MTGEAIRFESEWFTGIGSSSTANGGMDTGTRTAANDATISANEKLYDLHDFQLILVSGSPNENSAIELYRIPNGGSAPGRTPTPSYLHEYIGAFVLDDATGSYYLYGVAVGDPKDTYITRNQAGATLTYLVSQRTRTTGPAT